jgi:lipopolysaccharide/colanic/teichoic acid biosynthesis glycosyltransferase
MPEPASITLIGTGCLGLAVRMLQAKYRAAKPYVDWVGALVLLIMTGPVIAACAVLIKLTSRGPVLYSQERVGQGGRIFSILKLRTMRPDAEAGTGPVWANGHDDARVTPVGRVLRRLHLDELPQLINVLRGEMSLIGPRPERPELVERLKEEMPKFANYDSWLKLRLSVKPGITGFAQVHAGYDRTVRDVRRKVRLDCRYISRMCWWVDFLIIVGTFSTVLLGQTERREKRAKRTVVRA